jgi:hypothetical protein
MHSGFGAARMEHLSAFMNYSKIATDKRQDLVYVN